MFVVDVNAIAIATTMLVGIIRHIVASSFSPRGVLSGDCPIWRWKLVGQCSYRELQPSLPLARRSMSSAKRRRHNLPGFTKHRRLVSPKDFNRAHARSAKDSPAHAPSECPSRRGIVRRDWSIVSHPPNHNFENVLRGAVKMVHAVPVPGGMTRIAHSHNAASVDAEALRTLRLAVLTEAYLTGQERLIIVEPPPPTRNLPR